MLTKMDKKVMAGKKMNESSMGKPMMKKEGPKTEITIKKTEPPKEEKSKEDKAEGEKETEGIKISSTQLPEIPKWQVGKEYPVRLKLIKQEDAGGTVVGEFQVVSK